MFTEDVLSASDSDVPPFARGDFVYYGPAPGGGTEQVVSVERTRDGWQVHTTRDEVPRSAPAADFKLLMSAEENFQELKERAIAALEKGF
jgi:hypothetical protein